MQLINDLSVKLNTYKTMINASVERVVASGWLVLGPEVQQFERAFADYNQVAHCASVANGTDALELALKALGVGPGDVVVTVANAGGYTATALSAVGATPLFVDVGLESQCMALASLEVALSQKVKAVVVTHLFGRATPDIIKIAQLCKQAHIPLLEDCAQAHGAMINGKRVGSFGDAAAFSFYPTKNLGALGDGGAVISHDQSTDDRVRQLRQYGWQGKYDIGCGGGRNSRLDELQAALLSDFLPHLDDWNTQRLSIASQYEENIEHGAIEKPKFDAGSGHYVAHLYVIQSDHRDSLKQHLRENEVLTDIHYPIPDHQQKVLAELNGGFKHDTLEVTEGLSRRILTLPCYPGMTEEQVENVVQSVNGWSL